MGLGSIFGEEQKPQKMVSVVSIYEELIRDLQTIFLPNVKMTEDMLKSLAPKQEVRMEPTITERLPLGELVKRGKIVCSNFDVPYLGDPLLKPVNSQLENATVVRLSYKLSKFLQSKGVVSKRSNGQVGPINLRFLASYFLWFVIILSYLLLRFFLFITRK